MLSTLVNDYDLCSGCVVVSDVVETTISNAIQRKELYSGNVDVDISYRELTGHFLLQTFVAGQYQQLRRDPDLIDEPREAALLFRKRFAKQCELLRSQIIGKLRNVPIDTYHDFYELNEPIPVRDGFSRDSYGGFEKDPANDQLPQEDRELEFQVFPLALGENERDCIIRVQINVFNWKKIIRKYKRIRLGPVQWYARDSVESCFTLEVVEHLRDIQFLRQIASSTLLNDEPESPFEELLGLTKTDYTLHNLPYFGRQGIVAPTDQGVFQAHHRVIIEVIAANHQSQSK